ncbi:DUF5050 domain-containing protein [Acidicapsa dinghuensis]|uniref:DUF5050 domain-containing protein n=1 Tax=Acidicapsa dinghuensis TaxID=2218256 RepID=A0ABW1EJK3_9BACT|nr:DUF5050 domain-containing protein [Acidicapsa dinghuensis]
MNMTAPVAESTASDIQNQIGNNSTASSPFVTADEVIFFRGPNNKLMRVNSDGTGLSQLGNNTTNSTPFVTSDGWVWFQGTDDKLYKVFNDGSQLSRPGANDTTSSPTVVGGWVYFRGKNNQLYRMDSAGSEQTWIGKQNTNSTPFVTSDGWVWFQGTDNKLYKIFNDGSQLSRPGANDTISSPTVVGGWVYFRGKDNQLYRMDTAGSEQTWIGKQTTKSTPFVTSDGWVWFQGTDNHLYRVFNDGTQLTRPGANDTASTPVIGRVEISEGTVGEWVYFQSTDNKLNRLFQPVAPIATGTMRPKYYILTVLYAPPGMNGGGSVSSVLGNVVSSVNYSSASSTGTATSVSSSFKDGVTVETSIGLNIPLLTKFEVDAQFNASQTTTDQTSETITSSTTFAQNVPGPGADGINHDHDMFVLMLNPLIGVAIYPGNIMQWNMGVNGPVMNIQFPYVGWLKNPSTMPPGVKQQLDAAGLTAADYAQILTANPFAQGATAIDSNRFVPTPQTYPYQPPFSASDPVFTNTITLQSSVTESENHTVQNQYSVSVSVEADFNLLLTPKLKITGSLEWTNTNSYGTSSTSTQTAAATVGGPAFGYSGPTDVVVYWDTLYSSFLFAFPAASPTVVGTLTDASGKVVANKAITLTVGGKKFETFTNQQGQYRFYGAPAGSGSLVVDGSPFAITVGAGAPPGNIRLH